MFFLRGGIGVCVWNLLRLGHVTVFVMWVTRLPCWSLMWVTRDVGHALAMLVSPLVVLFHPLDPLRVRVVEVLQTYRFGLTNVPRQTNR